MANFGNLNLTRAGVEALLASQAGEKLVLNKIKLGRGANPESILPLTDLVEPVVELEITNFMFRQSDGYIVIESILDNEGLTTGFEWREIGIFFLNSDGESVLYAYSNCGEHYDFIPAVTDQRYVKHIRIADVVSDAENITIVEKEGLVYIDALTFNETIAELEGKINVIVSDDNSEKYQFGIDENGVYVQLIS